MEKSKRFNLLLFIIGLIIGFLLCYKCSPRKNDTVTSIIHSRDTIRLIHPSVTITQWRAQKVRVIKQIDSVYYGRLDSIRVYTGEYSDSNLSINYTDSLAGILFDKRLTYILKVPQYIIDSIVITKEVLQTPEKFYMGLGAELGQKNVSITAGIGKKNKFLYYRYNVLENTHNIGFMIRKGSF